MAGLAAVQGSLTEGASLYRSGDAMWHAAQDSRSGVHDQNDGWEYWTGSGPDDAGPGEDSTEGRALMLGL